MSARPTLTTWIACALVTLGAARARASEPSPPPPPAPLSFTLFAEAAAFVPDPIQAPPARQLEAGVAMSRGDGAFLRLRAGGALRSLGADVLGLIEGGVGGVNAWGIVGDVAVGVGARQQFTAGDLYVAQDDGTVERATDFGTTLVLATLSAGVGYDFRALAGPPLRVLLVPRFQLTLPQRDQAAVELGVGVRAGWTF